LGDFLGFFFGFIVFVSWFGDFFIEFRKWSMFSEKTPFLKSKMAFLCSKMAFLGYGNGVFLV